MFLGHGSGPGHGLGQWGAFGLATLDHWTYREILSHYYSDAARPVTDATLSATADAQVVSVAIQENDNSAVTVTSPSAFTYVVGPGAGGAGRTVATIPAGHSGRAVEIKKSGVLTGLWELETASSCSAKTWTEVATGLTDPTALPASLAPGAPPSELLTLCEASGRDVTFRGRLEAYDYLAGPLRRQHQERTIDLVGIEQYVADVTPSESPSDWGSFGGRSAAPQGEPWGFQELEAQAVAARTYLLYSISSGGWHGYADICDAMCEWYGQGVEYETPLATLAVRDTAGQYLVQGGGPAPTEYGSSSGGYTDGLDYSNGQPIFASVPDPADGVCIGGPQSIGCNPWHSWTVAIPALNLEKRFALGTLVSVKVTATDTSGRATELEIVGTKAATSLSGTVLAADFALPSTMFSVSEAAGGSAAVGPGRARASMLRLGSPGFRPPVSVRPAEMPAGGSQ